MRAIYILIFCLIVLAGVGVVYWQPEPEPMPQVAPAAGEENLPEPAAITPIAPGTKIDPMALPAGTHLVFRSQPKLTSGEPTKVNKSVREALQNFTTLVLLDTEPDPDHAGQFRRKSHRIGVGKPGEGGDVVVTREAASDIKVSLGVFERKVLGERQKELATVKSPGASPTMAMFDFTMMYRRDGKRTPIVARYMAVVDPQTGDVDTAYWALDVATEGYTFVGDSLRVLPTNHVMDWEMHVDGSKTTLGAPHADAFTSTKLPDGAELKVSDDFKKAAAARSFSAATGAELERRVREILQERRS